MQIAILAAGLAAYLALPAHHRYGLQSIPGLGGPFQIAGHRRDPVLTLLNAPMTALGRLKVVTAGMFAKAVGQALVKPCGCAQAQVPVIGF